MDNLGQELVFCVKLQFRKTWIMSIMSLSCPLLSVHNSIPERICVRVNDTPFPNRQPEVHNKNEWLSVFIGNL